MARYAEQTKDAVLQRMIDNSPADVDKRQGSITNDLLSPAAIEFQEAYTQLDNVLSFGFADENTPREFLVKRCAELGVTPKLAMKATGQVTFSGTDGMVIPIGSRVGTESEIYFVTTTEGTITGGSAMVSAEAEVAGANGNVAQGFITLVLSNLSGVTSVTNALAFEGGTDEESDDSLLARYYEHVRKPATSGNANHYLQWAKEVAGVSDAKVYPIWNGTGTVKVVLLGEDKRAASQTIIDNVVTHIESVRPIGATVTVVGATETPINISATLTLASGKTIADATSEIQTEVTKYLQSLAFVDSIVRYSQIGSIILNAESVLDYTNLTVNSGTANVQVTDGAVAVLGTVTLS